jgi:hypothetical protein
MVPPRLAFAVGRSLSAIPALRERFGILPVPLCQRTWELLPLTDRSFYTQLGSAANSVRRVGAFFQVVPPLRLSRPLLPFSVHESWQDRALAQKRVCEILARVPLESRKQLVILVDDDALYFAAEFAELAIKGGFSFTVCLVESLDSVDIHAQLCDLHATLIMWLLPRLPRPGELPSMVTSLITVNMAEHTSTLRWHADVAHVDPVPYFGFRVGASSYEVLLDHCHMETVDGRLVVTTLTDQLFPVVRLDTEIAACYPQASCL